MYSTRKLLAFLSSRVDGGVADEERHDLAGQFRGRGDGVPRRRTDLGDDIRIRAVLLVILSDSE